MCEWPSRPGTSGQYLCILRLIVHIYPCKHISCFKWLFRFSVIDFKGSVESLNKGRRFNCHPRGFFSPTNKWWRVPHIEPPVMIAPLFSTFWLMTSQPTWSVVGQVPWAPPPKREEFVKCHKPKELKLPYFFFFFFPKLPRLVVP